MVTATCCSTPEHNNTSPCTITCRSYITSTCTHTIVSHRPKPDTYYINTHVYHLSTATHILGVKEHDGASVSQAVTVHGKSDGTTMPIIAPKTPINTSMDIVDQWFIIFLLSVITDMAFYSPSAGDNDLDNKQLYIVVASHAQV